MNKLRARLAANPEEGSLAAYFVLIVVVLMVMMGFVIDSSGKYSEVEHAQMVASGASRTAVNSLTGAALQNGSIAVQTVTAQAAAENYITAAGMTGTVTVTGEVITVNVETSYTTKFLSLIGVNELPAAATASAQLITN